jgi:hypothetical protein
MIFEYAAAVMAFAGLVSVFNLVLAIIGLLPSLWSVGGNAVLLLAMLGQIVVTVTLLLSGSSPVGDIFEIFGYQIATLLVLAGAVLWSLVERTKTSTLVLAIAPFTALVMVARLLQIWG